MIVKKVRRKDLEGNFPDDEIRDGGPYSERIRKLLVEEGALSYEEDAFMQGYEEADSMDQQYQEDIV